MKNIILILIIASSAFLFSCSKKFEAKDLEGTWIIHHRMYYDYTSNVGQGTKYTFTSTTDTDGLLVIENNDGTKFEYNYNFNGTYLTTPFNSYTIEKSVGLLALKSNDSKIILTRE